MNRKSMPDINQPRPFPFQPDEPAAEPALAVETERMRQLLRKNDPEDLSRRIGGILTSQGSDKNVISVDLWGGKVMLNFPELVVYREPQVLLPLPFQALLIYYLFTSDGSAATGEWVSFADLSGGRIYAQAFQGYSGNRLVHAFGENVSAFRQACLSTGGEPIDLGDAAYIFPALPRISLLVTYWQGEDVIPSASKVLFDRNATNHLPIDVCAILGSMLVSRILKNIEGKSH